MTTLSEQVKSICDSLDRSGFNGIRFKYIYKLTDDLCCNDTICIVAIPYKPIHHFLYTILHADLGNNFNEFRFYDDMNKWLKDQVGSDFVTTYFRDTHKFEIKRHCKE